MRTITLLFAFLAIMLPMKSSADEDIRKFIASVLEAAHSDKPEKLEKIALKMPESQQVIDRFFMAKGLHFRSCEVATLEEAKEKWPKIAPALIESLNVPGKEDQMMRILWSDVPEGAGRMEIAQFFVFTEKDGTWRLRLE